MQTIVIGALNTDLIATGINKFPKSGELVHGKELLIGAGGKSRNIADMIAHLMPKNTVAMVGRTIKDPYGLWKMPVDALKKSTVNTDYVNILDYKKVKKLPGIAIIPVDLNGNNQIYLLPGVSNDFCIGDIDRAEPLFKLVGANKGNLVLTLECPLETALYAIKLANKYNLKVLLDPGGLQFNKDIDEIIKAGVYFIKPNEHEAKILTGVKVTNFKSAEQAAKKLQAKGINNVFITHGANGAYLFTKKEQVHITIPKVIITKQKDATGCGDQTMAVVCALLCSGKSLLEATRLSIVAGTLQYYKLGIKPITKKELGL